MTILIALIAVAAFTILGLIYFANAPTAQVAGSIRVAGPVALALVGVVLSLAGRIGAGAPLIMMALAWFGRQRQVVNRRRSTGQRSTVRSAWLEMMLDHDTGDMNGLVLVGPFEGRELDDMSEDELRNLAEDLADDRESAELLEAYLDRRMPGWRDDADPDVGARKAGPHDTGTVTEQEAYKILGLEPGATASQIRQAHRSLMQRVHPDLGGNAFLAQRVNEARDVLLRNHADRDP
ncbi:DnaJ domain-containing protein [Oricola cellulosilytica]|uniref:Molecular chaperone DnaJ n=1 Tax=Oricola cellulosilytica TaxID=1429082 RepID=A0A4R0PAM0_9HYPH|nr:DnaJ domain-containing protein [Oricola cellulosilytica]TCD13227.1 molecular chaperone DnaJ [Oricola cellulosilytica]